MTQFSDRSPSAQEGPSSRLAAPALGGQGVGTINVDDQVHMSLSDVFAQLCDAGFSVAGANKAIYQSLDRLGYLERGANAKKLRTLMWVQAFLDLGYGVLLGVALSLAAFIYGMDVVARSAQGVL